MRFENFSARDTYERCVGRMRELLGRKFDEDRAHGAMAFNSNIESHLDELERELEGKTASQQERIREMWLEENDVRLKLGH